MLDAPCGCPHAASITSAEVHAAALCSKLRSVAWLLTLRRRGRPRGTLTQTGGSMEGERNVHSIADPCRTRRFRSTLLLSGGGGRVSSLRRHPVDRGAQPLGPFAAAVQRGPPGRLRAPPLLAVGADCANTQHALPGAGASLASAVVLLLLAGVGAMPIFGIAHGHIQWISAYELLWCRQTEVTRRHDSDARVPTTGPTGLKTGHIVRTMRLANHFLSHRFRPRPL